MSRTKAVKIHLISNESEKLAQPCFVINPSHKKLLPEIFKKQNHIKISKALQYIDFIHEDLITIKLGYILLKIISFPELNSSIFSIKLHMKYHF